MEFLEDGILVSKVFYNIIIDKDNVSDGIEKIVPIDPLKIKKIREAEKQNEKAGNQTIAVIKKIEEYYLYINTDKESYMLTGPAGLHLSMDSVVYVPSGVVDLNTKRVLGYLHKAIRPLNMLRQLEDAVLVYRIARAQKEEFLCRRRSIAKAKGRAIHERHDEPFPQ
jgi:hypothetical protein